MNIDKLMPETRQERAGLIVTILLILIIMVGITGGYYAVSRFAMIDTHSHEIHTGTTERAAIVKRVQAAESELRESRAVMQDVRILLGKIEERLPAR